MNILKLDLKILISLISLIFVISCTTTELTSYSEEFVEEPVKTNNEYDLEIISVSEMDDIRYSDEYSNISYTPYNEELYMPVPGFTPLERPDYISGYTSYTVDEFRLTPLTFVKLLKPQNDEKEVLAIKTKQEDLTNKNKEVLAIKTKQEDLTNKNKEVLADKSNEVALNHKNHEVLTDKTDVETQNNQKQVEPAKVDKQNVFITKTTEEKQSAKKQEVIVKNETSKTLPNKSSTKTPALKKTTTNTVTPSKVAVTKKAEVVKPKTVKKVTAVKKVIEPTPIKYIELGDMEVVVNKSFTVEMDQSGWLFEKSLDDILFKNKFYTNSSVLFEFSADSTGEYTLEFSKYRGEEILYSKIKILVVESQSIKEVYKAANDGVIITPDEVTEYLSEKELLEKKLQNIKSHKNPDEVYFKLAEIYYDEGLLRKAKEFYEYIYDNYPFSIYYTQAEERMNYIINNFLKVR